MSVDAVAEAFVELEASYTAQAAVVEANRCLRCFDAPCMTACPTHIDVPGFIKKIATGNLRGSALRILEANALALSCSRVCPVDVLCEGSCVMHARGERPIAIGRLQRHAMEDFYAAGAVPASIPAEAKPYRVACIGGGPASLACAVELRRQGVAVTVYEGRTQAGGLNVHGVAEYKLAVQDARREVDYVRSLDVDIVTGQAVGTDVTLAELEANFAAIFIGAGLGAGANPLKPCPGGPQVFDALDYIEAYKSREPLPIGPRVVVLGGGNTAIDAACAAKRLGAERVTLVYRRGEREMPAFAFEIEHARHEGIAFLFQAEPVALRMQGIEFRRVRLGRVDASGRPQPEPEVGSEFVVAADTVITAMGQSKLVELFRACGVELEQGKVRINPATGATSHPKYFAGGDCVSGGGEVVDAVADGKRAALGIVRAMEVKLG